MVAALLTCFLVLAQSPSGIASDKPQLTGVDPQDVKVPGQRDLVQNFPWKFRLPEIVRIRDLPQRMLNEPFLEEADTISEIPDNFIATWIRCFQDAEDLEIRIVATEHLSRIARLKQVDLTPITNDLVKTLQSTSSRRLVWGCLAVIRDANLKQTADALTDLSASGDDDLRRLIDPLLLQWQHQPAIEVWMSRIQNQTSSTTSRLLACRSLAALKVQKSAQPIAEFVTDPAASFQLRSAAAVAVNQLQPSMARALSVELLKGEKFEKLLAIKLLNQPHEDALNQLVTLCENSNPAVAVAAWDTVEAQDAERLLPLLEQGIQNSESGIRQCCCRLTARFPTTERIEWAFPMMADQHLSVRNACRKAMTEIGQEDLDLQQPIVDLAAQQLNNPQAPWQALEQACYLLAKFRRPEFAEIILPLCRHERPEVFVAAAWLFHLMPEPKLKQEFRQLMEERIQLATTGSRANNPIFRELDLQIGLLFQTAGYCKFMDELPHMMQQLNKQSGLGEQARSAGIWAIGALKAGTKDKATTKQLIGRLNDRNHPTFPEFNLARRMAAQAIGRIQSETAITHLESAFEEDGPPTYIPQTARWALQIFGNPSLGPIRPGLKPPGAWKLLPLEQQD